MEIDIGAHSRNSHYPLELGFFGCPFLVSLYDRLSDSDAAGIAVFLAALWLSSRCE
jgi:hypothetical protein